MAEMACSKLPARSATDRGTARKRTNPLHNATPAMVMVSACPRCGGVGEVDDDEDDEYEEEEDDDDDRDEEED